MSEYDYLNWPETINRMCQDNVHRSAFFESPCKVLSEAEGIILYGAGIRGVKCYQKLILHNVKVLAFCDSDEKLNGKRICQVPIISLSELVKYDKRTPIIVTPLGIQSEIEEILHKHGFDNVYHHEPGLDAKAFYSGGSEEKLRVLREGRQKIEFVKESFADNHSSKVFDAAIGLWMDADFSYAKSTITSGEYFPNDIIVLGDEEVFVDCGGFDGDSILEFVRHTGGKYKAIYSFEADEMNYELAKANIRKHELAEVFLYNMGVYSHKAELRFAAEQSVGSRISDTGKIVIHVDSLDNLLLKSSTPPVTYIKLDIEGSEKEALLGAKNLILKDRPRLAVCVYHKFGDIWEIPYFILNEFEGYKIYLRNGRADCDFVCFAIPNSVDIVGGYDERDK